MKIEITKEEIKQHFEDIVCQLHVDTMPCESVFVIRKLIEQLPEN